MCKVNIELSLLFSTNRKHLKFNKNLTKTTAEHTKGVRMVSLSILGAVCTILNNSQVTQ